MHGLRGRDLQQLGKEAIEADMKNLKIRKRKTVSFAVVGED